jgi:hypothetical protein
LIFLAQKFAGVLTVWRKWKSEVVRLRKAVGRMIANRSGSSSADQAAVDFSEDDMSRIFLPLSILRKLKRERRKLMRSK